MKPKVIFQSLISSILLLLVCATVQAEPPLGYYRQPALHGDTLVFVAEGDLWKVGTDGGVATRLTTHGAAELQPAISPDGKTLAFAARYEGTTELYTMPLSGGLPTRRTWGARSVEVSSWTPGGEIVYATSSYATLPVWQLVRLDIADPEHSGTPHRIPLSQAANGWFADDGTTLFFNRPHAQGSHTKRYKGGTAEKIWRFGDGDDEATPLTEDYSGTSTRPMPWNGRVYFASDRDGTMNLWSMLPDGSDLKQHTTHDGWDVYTPYLQGGRIVYQFGADIHLYDIAADRDRKIEIRLDSDLDQTRENWVSNPMSYTTSVAISPDGDRAVLTARGRIFVAPHRHGRLVEVTQQEGVRNRNARFMPDGETLLTLSDESDEVELWTQPANGVGEGKQLTRNGDVLRWEAVPSPDGKWIAHYDKNQRLFLYDVEKEKDQEIDQGEYDTPGGPSWSPDSRWLAYHLDARTLFDQIKIYDTETGETHTVTTDRYDSWNAVFSPDGKWLYFLSNRNLVSIVGSPWGSYQPEPHLDRKAEVFHLALTSGLRSPFRESDELEDKKDDEDEGEDEEDDDDAKGKNDKKKKDDDDGDDQDKKDEKDDVVVEIDFDGLQGRLEKVPVDPGNYSALSVVKKALFLFDRTVGERSATFKSIKIQNTEPVKAETVLEGASYYDLSLDGKKLLLRKNDSLYIVDAKAGKASLDDADVNLSGWALSVVPREEWRQMFVDAWRLERDYFYDTGMHGVNWKKIRTKYEPLVDRVTNRGELSNLIGQMVSELSALHIFVRGGDNRDGSDNIQAATLGALLARDETAGGYRVEHIYQADPDEPDQLSPLMQPGVEMAVGDVIQQINGRSTLSVPDYGMLLRRQAGKQVLLHVLPADAEDDAAREVIVRPIGLGRARDLRYDEWEYTRRLEVEEQGAGEMGYVHLRAMGGRNYTEWAKNYFPVFMRSGLIIDVRNNRGGNIDSWILNRLLRQAWFGWTSRVGTSLSWNMQYAFRGHVVVLCNEWTASDGEAFAEGIKRLDIGTVIGTRTWGGEIWLTSSNVLVDRGIATAAEYGVYGPEGDWLIEGHGVEPHIVVDNLPHATFNGEDAQLDAAIEFLKKKIKEEPIPPLEPPTYPDKSYRN